MPAIRLDLTFKEPYETINTHITKQFKQGWYYFRISKVMIYYNDKGMVHKLDGPAMFAILEPAENVLYVSKTFFLVDGVQYPYSQYEQHIKVIASKIDNIIKLVEEFDE